MEINIKDGYKVTEVGVIPDDWEVKKLGDIVKKIVGGGTPSRNIKDYWNGNIFWATVKDFTSFSPYETQETITQEGLNSSASNLIPKGNLIISTRMAVGKVVIYNVDVAINQDLKGVFTKPDIDTNFLFYCFISYSSNIDFLASGSTVKGIVLEDLKNIEIPLPPLAEQKAIAHALSDVDNLITAIDQLIIKKRNIKQGTMQELLTGKKRLPGFSGKWEVKKLGDIGSFKKGKNIPKKVLTLDGVLCVLYGEIYTKYNYYSESLESRISPDLAKESTEINSGDILFAGSGETFEEIGKCFAYLGVQKACAGGDIIILSPHIDNSYFLSYLLNSYQVNIQKSNLGQGSSVIHIYVSNLKSIEIPLPPLPEQKAIAEILSDIDKEIEALEKNRDKYKALKQGMMQELLTGKTRIIDN